LIEISAIDADAIVAATAATINFFIIYSVSCEKKPPQNCKDGVNYTSVYRKVNTFLQKKYKKVFFYNKKQK
jgi:hypothetical protein